MTPLRSTRTELYRVSVKIAQIYEWFYGRFGSLAVIKADISLMTASGGKADVRNAEIHKIEGPLSARSRHRRCFRLKIQGHQLLAGICTEKKHDLEFRYPDFVRPNSLLPSIVVCRDSPS